MTREKLLKILLAIQAAAIKTGSHGEFTRGYLSGILTVAKAAGIAEKYEVQRIQAAKTIDVSPDIMIEIDGKTFKCDCGSNVFHHPMDAIEKYQCNGCCIRYEGEG